MKLSERAVDAVIATHLDYIIGDSRVFWGVLGSCSEDDIRAWAKEHHFELTRFTSGVHASVPSKGGWRCACTCGWGGHEPCPWWPAASRRA
jgi:hypothetical protein